MPAEIIAQTGPGAVAPAVTPKAAPVVAPPAAAAPTKSPELLAMEKQLSDERRMREVALQKQKTRLEEGAKKEREGLGPKLARLAEYEKDEQRAKLDPSGYLEKKYGKDWYDVVINAKLNGGAPSADVVALKLTEMEEKFEAKLSKRDEEAKAAQAEAVKTQVAEARREQVAFAAEFWASASKEFPLVDGLGTPEQVAAEIARRREAHYDATKKTDADGRFVAHGQILPLQKIAEMWEGQLVSLAQRAAGHAKYAGKFAAPAVVAPKHVDQQRRTLSNDLTGSTPRSAPVSDSEKRARAIAAYEARSKPPV
jgi:hypothetical protein